MNSEPTPNPADQRLLAQDGNFFWEICFTERPEWIEPDRWHQTVCNFLLVRKGHTAAASPMPAPATLLGLPGYVPSGLTISHALTACCPCPLQLMAWERKVDRHRPLYPTARLQMLRDLWPALLKLALLGGRG